MSRRQFDGKPVKDSPREPETRGERRFHCLMGLLMERVRRQTFVDWTVTFMDPDKLAQAGFFYLKTKDHVQCTFCRGIVGYWDEGDVPVTEHKKHFPNCPFITGVATGNVPATAPPDTDEGRLYQLLNQFYAFKVANTQPSLSSTYQADSTRMLNGRQAAFLQYHSQVTRLGSFSQWPKDRGVDPEKLAEAGFFYTGLSDWVQCFNCGGGLFSWRREDNPIADHERNYPFCKFITMKRREVGGVEPCTEPIDQQRAATLTKEETELLLHHPLAKRLVEVGLSPMSVKEAFKLYLESHGVLCSTVTEGLEVVFDYDEKQRQNPSESCIDGVKLPENQVQRNHQDTPTETAMEVETKEPFFPPTPPPEHSGQPTTSDQAKLLQEVQTLRREVQEEERRLICRVCGKERVAVVFQPCSHLHLCADCARPRDTCITCGSVVRGTLRPIIG